jgi:copper chaperone
MFLPWESPAFRTRAGVDLPTVETPTLSGNPWVTGENTMRFHVDNMTCGHCDRTIRKAIAALSPEAKVAVDLRARTVAIDGTLTAAQIVTALGDEGYSAVRITEMA